MNPKLKLFSLGAALSLPVVAWFIFTSASTSSGAANNPSDSLVFSLLVYVVLSAALILYAAKKVGLYRPPVPHQVPGAGLYFQAVGIRLVLFWSGGALYTLYEGYTGEISIAMAILGASIFIVVIAGTCWLLHRDWSANARDLAPQSRADLGPARTDSVLSILLYSGLFLFVVFEVIENHLFVISAFFIGALLLGFIVIHSWSLARLNVAARQQLAPYPTSELNRNLSHSDLVGAAAPSGSPRTGDSLQLHEPEQDPGPLQNPGPRQLTWTPFGGPIPSSSKHDRILVYVLMALGFILSYLAH
ncbi:MAG: hypothetical protein ACRD5M_02835 [Candidatus Acidiferrales bacterium]